MTLTRDPDTWPTGDRPPISLLCVECHGDQFKVRWQHEDAIFVWQICCEQCGAIYDLLPDGVVQLRSR